MQPHPLTSVMQLAITGCAVCIAAVAIIFAIANARQERNAALVAIGVAVLRADPTKETHVSAAREWALDLIDANAGGVKFTAEAREELKRSRLDSEPLIGEDLNGWTPALIPPHAPPQ
jgi:hypothetical protein